VNKVPKYLFLPKNIVRLVLLTALFALIFINIYRPFNAESWYNVSKFRFFVYSSLVVLTGMLVIAISRLVLYFYARHKEIGITGYALWVVMEVFFMAIFYAVYTIIFKHGTDFIDAFARSLLYSTLIIIIPYSVIHLYLAYVSVDSQLQELRRNPVSNSAWRIYAFPDEHGDIQLSVTGNNLLYVESADNYVWIWYLNKNKPTRYILRNSLKNIERLFTNSSLQRCHRSYMINLDAVSVMSRGQDGVIVDFGVDSVPIIPVSVTYIEQITKWFKGYSAKK
jgi:hypothetical protein